VPKITNKKYKEFLETGLIDLISKEDFEEMLKKIDHKNIEQARILLILLYFTGRRPSELLNLKANDFEKEGSYLKIKMPTKKQGTGSIVYLPLVRITYVKELWDYISKLPPELWILWEFRGKSEKKIKILLDDGSIHIQKYKDTSYKIRYWVKKWSKKIGKEVTPYFFRHSRLSKMAMKGANVQELKYFKGAKSLSSVEPYLHLSQKKAKKMANMLD